MSRFSRLFPFLLIVVCAGIGMGINPLAHAQSDSLNLTLTSEENIGADCPISLAIDPSGMTAWVLTDNCNQGDFSLLTIGGQVTQRFSGALTDIAEGMNGTGGGTSLAFTSDGSLVISYLADESQPMTMRIPANTDAASNLDVMNSDAEVNALKNYTTTPERAVYTADRTLAAVVGGNKVHVVEMPTGAEVLAIETPTSDIQAIPQLSADGRQLYVTQPNGTAATLVIYSLPDGVLLSTYALPTFRAWVSPDGQKVALVLNSPDGTKSELVVQDLATGILSNALDIFEPSRTATTCVNTGVDVPFAGVQTSGRVIVTDLEWLPDSSGFLTINSHFGEIFNTDAGICTLEYSRLRRYTLSNG